jgi:hypothetical protein
MTKFTLSNAGKPEDVRRQGDAEVPDQTTGY